MKLIWKRGAKRCGAVIVAAGSGTRMQGVDKILLELGGMPVIARSIQTFEKSESIHEIVVVARQNQLEEIQQLVQDYHFQKVTVVVPGGETRIESVTHGLMALSRKAELAAIHDGARPLVTDAIITAAVEKARYTHAAAPGIPVKDTIKEIGERGVVTATPVREALRAVQTPQVFQKNLLMAAWKTAEQNGQSYTDDCGAMEAFGVPVFLVEGSEDNIKLTTPLDILVAEAILKRREEA